MQLLFERSGPIVIIKWKEILDSSRTPPTAARMSRTRSKASSSSTPDRMDTNLLAVTTLVVVALIFDYINGFHDAANSIATVVSTASRRPKAVVWAAFFNFVAAFTFGTAVAKTVAPAWWTSAW